MNTWNMESAIVPVTVERPALGSRSASACGLKGHPLLLDFDADRLKVALQDVYRG
jgi:hypothetical protein